MRICVCVYAQKQFGYVGENIKQAVQCSPFAIRVLDDSAPLDATNQIYSWKSRQALESGRLQVLRHNSSMTSVDWVLKVAKGLREQGYTHAVWLGERAPISAEDIPQLSSLAVAQPGVWHQLKSPAKPAIVPLWKLEFPRWIQKLLRNSGRLAGPLLRLKMALEPREEWIGPHVLYEDQFSSRSIDQLIPLQRIDELKGRERVREH